MPSTAALTYQKLSTQAQTLQDSATNPRFRPLKHQQIQSYYHAALAAHVAAWEAYIEHLVDEFISLVADPLNAKYHALHTLNASHANSARKRFNTPNWENSRTFLVLYTGFDPYSNWIWPSRKMGSTQVQSRLNEILQVRHSFAHGYPLPSYGWTQNGTTCSLTKKALEDTRLFFTNLVNRTDEGMKQYLLGTFGVTTVW